MGTGDRSAASLSPPPPPLQGAPHWRQELPELHQAAVRDLHPFHLKQDVLSQDGALCCSGKPQSSGRREQRQDSRARDPRFCSSPLSSAGLASETLQGPWRGCWCADLTQVAGDLAGLSGRRRQGRRAPCRLSACVSCALSPWLGSVCPCPWSPPALSFHTHCFSKTRTLCALSPARLPAGGRGLRPSGSGR